MSDPGAAIAAPLGLEHLLDLLSHLVIGLLSRALLPLVPLVVAAATDLQKLAQVAHGMFIGKLFPPVGLLSWFIVSFSQTRQTVSRFSGEGLLVREDTKAGGRIDCREIDLVTEKVSAGHQAIIIGGIDACG